MSPQDEVMEEVDYSLTIQKKRPIIACPLCGEQQPKSPQEAISRCPSCQFDLNLVVSDKQSPLPISEPTFVPHLVFWLLGIQVIVSGLFSIVFFFLASPLYPLAPQFITLLHVTAMVALGLFVFFLRQQKGIALIRIGLAIVGIITLPPGILAIGASLGVSPEKRRCIICGKQIRLTAYIQCPHCQAFMHRWGSCRHRRVDAVTTTLDSGTSLTQIESTCPNCFKLLHPHQEGRPSNG